MLTHSVQKGQLFRAVTQRPQTHAHFTRLVVGRSDANGPSSSSSALKTMGSVNGAYIEILERSRNSVTGILEHSSFPHFVAGLSAGVMECLVGHPLDTIRIGIMVSVGESVGPLEVLKQMAQGFSSPQALLEIYRGVNSEMLSAALGGALLFGVNELLKGTLKRIDARRKKKLHLQERRQASRPCE